MGHRPLVDLDFVVLVLLIEIDDEGNFSLDHLHYAGDGSDMGVEGVQVGSLYRSVLRLDDNALIANANVDLVVDGGVGSGHLRPEVMELAVGVVFHLAAQPVLVGSNHTITDVVYDLADHVQRYLAQARLHVELNEILSLYGPKN